MEAHKQEIISSLRVLIDILKQCGAEYRIIGSTLVVAYKNTLFRRIHDIDIILDAKKSSCVFEKLEEKGFTFIQRKWGGFRWVEAEKKGYLGLTFFLIGEFAKDYFTWKFSKIAELRIDSDYLRPTEYIFGGVRFVGIPISSAATGIKQAFLNPKRSLDKHILKEEMKNAKNTYGNINVYISGIKLPYVYDIFSFFYNVYGGTRVRFGGRWEAWE